MRNDAIAYNEKYWNNHADLWFGTTALPQYGVKFPTEDELKLIPLDNYKTTKPVSPCG